MAIPKKLVNASEEIAYFELQDVAAKYGYKVHLKVRVADVLPIDEMNIDNSLYSFALKSHFDFIVSSERHMPLFAVEFDGPSHEEQKQKQRDKKKDDLCLLSSFPLLRINDRHLLK